jgi:predicted dehydrogenase
LGCHLVDATATVLGRPDKILAMPNHVRPEVDDFIDDSQAVFGYANARATIRACATEFDGGRRRHFMVSGTDGSIDIRPLEQPKLVMTLREGHGDFKRGTREIELPAMPGRYDEHLLELARIVRGEKPAEYGPEHDLLVEEMILRASGLPVG